MEMDLYLLSATRSTVVRPICPDFKSLFLLLDLRIPADDGELKFCRSCDFERRAPFCGVRVYIFCALFFLEATGSTDARYYLYGS